MPGVRRKARMLALQALYEIDCVGHSPDDTVDRLIQETRLPQNAQSFSQELVRGVLEHREMIDHLIQEAAPLWPIGQLAVIDRNILRLAILEILFNNKVPMKAAINEAVELARAFGSENSAKFVNGVLGTLSAYSIGEQKSF